MIILPGDPVIVTCRAYHGSARVLQVTDEHIHVQVGNGEMRVKRSEVSLPADHDEAKAQGTGG